MTRPAISRDNAFKKRSRDSIATSPSRSKLRKVSLTRLERIIKEHIAEGQPIDDAMQHLAGLNRIQYVFCYPKSGDIVIAGPAEAWAEAPSGRMLAVDSGRPVLDLDDLVVALRAFPPGKDNKKPFIYCSIDPTEEGLSRLHQFLHELGGRIGDPRKNPGQDQFIVDGLRDRLGMQVITVGGVSPKTHFAQVMVEADYRMKLIGIGLENPPVHLTSYVDRAKPSQVASNALQRWYFVPNYQCVRVSEDAMAMELVGEGVKLVGEDEAVSQDGKRHKAARGNPASDAFVKAFTKVYPQLAQRAPVYAQLRNCIDMAVAAAFIQHQDYYQLANWNAETFNDEDAIKVEKLNPPQQVETAVNMHVARQHAHDPNRRRRPNAPDRSDRPHQHARRQRRQSPRSPHRGRPLQAARRSMVVGLAPVVYVLCAGLPTPHRSDRRSSPRCWQTATTTNLTTNRCS